MPEQTFKSQYQQLRTLLMKFGEPVDTGQWQSQDDVPMTATHEIQFVTLRVDVPVTPIELAADVEPNMPWAEDHFQERVSGYAWNPPPSAADWPHVQQGHEDHTSDSGRFSHTYPERLWPYGINPAAEGMSQSPYINMTLGGDVDWIVGQFGDLEALVRLLLDYRHTRQAFIPIWWPCDGMMAGALRVPCTIGYHFIIRDDKLDCHYFMRSCDMLRHLRDDVYMAARLMQWIAGALPHTTPGRLVMPITSLHVFESDMQLFKAGLQ